MAEFTLDTSGFIPVPYGSRFRGDKAFWSDLSPFEQGFTEGAFADLPVLCERCQGNGEIVTDWPTYLNPPEGADADAGTSTCPACDGQGRPTYAFHMLHPEALALILRDCSRDQAIGLRLGGMEDRHSLKAGRRFWTERQTGNLFDCPRLTPYLSDEGKVLFKEAA